ncbi:hypothetical protein SDC9_75212 [bioreactor metagenome]|uniref:Uncharacterized protein n=1 Tax=bioreactor metagenome TaxID=1076179 RepID=A0A644YJD0_9ZZZZ
MRSAVQRDRAGDRHVGVGIIQRRQPFARNPHLQLAVVAVPESALAVVQKQIIGKIRRFSGDTDSVLFLRQDGVASKAQHFFFNLDVLFRKNRLLDKIMPPRLNVRQREHQYVRPHGVNQRADKRILKRIQPSVFVIKVSCSIPPLADALMAQPLALKTFELIRVIWYLLKFRHFNFLSLGLAC